MLSLVMGGLNTAVGRRDRWSEVVGDWTGGRDKKEEEESALEEGDQVDARLALKHFLQETK